MTQLDGYCAVVVTFRRPASLERVLESLASQTVRPNVIVVADNDHNRSAESVVVNGEWGDVPVQYLPLEANVGPAGGWAAAAQVASPLPDRGAWLLVVDDDDPLGHPELVERLLRSAQTLPGPDQCAGIGLRGATLRHLGSRLERVEGPEGLPMPVDYLASGGAPLYRWDAIEEIGFFDSDLFFGFEDLDLGLRLTEAGWGLWAVSLSSLHVVANTSSERVPWREYFKARALVAISRRHLGLPATAAALLRSVLFGGLWLAIRERDGHLALARLAGASDALRGHMGPNGRAPQVNTAKRWSVPTSDVLEILIVSGASVGGAARSTVELAEALHARGHRTTVILGVRPSDTSLLGLARRAVNKVSTLPGGSISARLFQKATSQASEIASEPGHRVLQSPFPEHAGERVLDAEPVHLVVANSLSRNTLRTLRDAVAARGIPLCLYLREAQGIKHLSQWGIRPDLIVGNSEHLARQVRALGLECAVVPSAIETVHATIESTRTALLMVNPIRENRPELAIAIARARPDIPVVLQESWPLSPADRRALEATLQDLENVELRPRSPNPAAIYRDARVLFAPYASGRPRVVVEAQHNEIPSVALDQPALAEAVGSAGVLVPPDASIAEWVAAVVALWDDLAQYGDFRERCRAQSEDRDTDPAVVAARFEAIVHAMLQL